MTWDTETNRSSGKEKKSNPDLVTEVLSEISRDFADISGLVEAISDLLFPVSGHQHWFKVFF